MAQRRRERPAHRPRSPAGTPVLPTNTPSAIGATPAPITGGLSGFPFPIPSSSRVNSPGLHDVVLEVTSDHRLGAVGYQTQSGKRAILRSVATSSLRVTDRVPGPVCSQYSPCRSARPRSPPPARSPSTAPWPAPDCLRGQPGRRLSRLIRPQREAAINSAIWIAFSAAPLRRLSLLTNSASPRFPSHRRVLTDPADEGRVGAGGLQRRRDVRELHAGRDRRAVASPARRGARRELGVDRQRVAGEDRHAHAGAAPPQTGDGEDLARLVAQLLLLVGLPRSVVDERAGHRHAR